MRQREAELQDLDAEVLVIGFEAERRVGGYCRRYKIPFPCLVDESRQVYGTYGMGQASWLQTLTPRAIAPYLRRALSGKLVQSRHDQDIRQRGGDFVIGRDGRLRLAYVSDDPADRPPIEQIIAALQD